MRVVCRRPDQKVEKIDPRFVAGKYVITVYDVGELFHQMVIVKITAELDRMCADHFAEVVRSLEGIFDQVVGTAGHTDRHPRPRESNLGNTCTRRLDRQNSASHASEA